MAIKVSLKVLLKSVIILLVAGIIAGGFYFLVTRSQASSAIQGDSSIRFEQHSQSPGEISSRASLLGRPEREFGDRGFEGRQGRNGSLVAWLEIARNLGLIALITLFVVGLQWIPKRLKRRPIP